MKKIIIIRKENKELNRNMLHLVGNLHTQLHEINEIQDKGR